MSMYWRFGAGEIAAIHVRQFVPGEGLVELERQLLACEEAAEMCAAEQARLLAEIVKSDEVMNAMRDLCQLRENPSAHDRAARLACCFVVSLLMERRERRIMHKIATEG